jgi:periplasmic protein TonB
MFRLRTTSTLSLLALVVGIAGTQWLSDLSGGSAVATSHLDPRLPVHHASALRVVHHGHARPSVAESGGRYAAVPPVVAASRAVQRPAAVAWVPVSMPVSSMPFARMRHHDTGNLVLHLVVDGQGQVAQAWLAQSSGDTVLDANALAVAKTWRFAVPADHPDGFSGDLPLSFTAS